MSVAEEADVPVNGSKDITLAVSMSELEHMSTSAVICDQDMVGLGRGGTGHKAIMGVYEGDEHGIYWQGVGSAGGGHELDPSPPMPAKLTLEAKNKNNPRESGSHPLRWFGRVRITAGKKVRAIE